MIKLLVIMVSLLVGQIAIAIPEWLHQSDVWLTGYRMGFFAGCLIGVALCLICRKLKI